MFFKIKSLLGASKRCVQLFSSRFSVIAAAAVVSAATLGPMHIALAQNRTLPDFTDLVEQVGPSVVNIRTSEKAKASAAGGGIDEQMLEFFKRFGIPVPPNVPRSPRPDRGGVQPEESPPRGVGSGFQARNRLGGAPTERRTIALKALALA